MPLECALYYTDALGIKGSNIKGGREDSSAVIELNHEVRSPRDVQTGQATGARIHSPVRILKEVDAASPLLYKALTRNEILPELEIKWYRVVDGVETEYYHHKLKNVRVVSVEDVLLNSKGTEFEHMPHVERVALGYEEITWTWDDGGLEHSDNWRAAAS
jgi:type VI secretion system secreted protein Hcp